MKKILIILSTFFILFILALYFLVQTFNLTKENIIAIIGFYVVSQGLFLTYFQLRINLNYNKRKAATDFMFGEITNYLQPLEIRLKSLLGKQFLIFDKNESLNDLLQENTIDEKTKEEIKIIVLQILNFYERMAIAIFKEAFEEDICYDDKGLLLISFHRWTKGYITDLRKKVNDDRIGGNFINIALNWEERYSKKVEQISKHKAKSDEKLKIENRDIL